MQDTDSSQFDIKNFWRLLQRRKYAALSAALAVLSVFTWGSFFLPKVYEASSTVFIERSSLINPLMQGVGVAGSMEERLRTLRYGIMSRTIIERVVKKLDLDAKVRNPAQYEGVIEDIRKSLNLTTVGDSGGSRGIDLFKISYRGGNPETVRDLVNTLVNEYIKGNVRHQRKDVHGAYEFINSQILEYKKRLEESDGAIREFRERNPHMVPQNEQTMLTRLEGFQSSKIEADIKLKELLMKRDNLQRQLSGEKELTVAFVTREGSPQSRLNYLNNQLVILMTKYTDNYPEVIKVKGEIEELKRQMAQAKESRTEGHGAETAAINPIYQQLREELARTDAEIGSIRARSAELLRQQQVAQGILGRMPKEQEEWAKLQRDRNVYQKVYDDLLEKLENARVSNDLELADKTGTFRIVDLAVLPQVPLQPDRVKMILIGIALGIASSIGIVFLLEHLDHSFKDEDSVTAKLKQPVLATIPRIVTEADSLLARRLDRRVFTAAGLYLFCIALVLAGEFLYRFLGIRIIHF
jgi:polysaccharide chain length determinant protein (PEP-CTERM system associated)